MKNFIALDLEMNDTPDRPIIQVGFVIGNVQQILYKHKSYHNCKEKLSPFIKKLTGITQHQVDTLSHRSLPDVYREMEYLAREHKCFSKVITWGGNDLSYLRTKANVTTRDYLSSVHLDLKGIHQSYQLANDSSARAGLSKAMTKYGLKFSGRCHDATDDAENTLLFYFHFLTTIFRKPI